METQRVSSKDAAREIGCCVEYLHRKMKSGEWDLGKVVKPGRGGERYRYLIFRPKLNVFLGVESIE